MVSAANDLPESSSAQLLQSLIPEIQVVATNHLIETSRSVITVIERGLVRKPPPRGKTAVSGNGTLVRARSRSIESRLE